MSIPHRENFRPDLINSLSVPTTRVRGGSKMNPVGYEGFGQSWFHIQKNPTIACGIQLTNITSTLVDRKHGSRSGKRYSITYMNIPSCVNINDSHDHIMNRRRQIINWG